MEGANGRAPKVEVKESFCSSQESSSQPPCSPESPPWPPPTHWPPPAWMRSARSRPWPKQLLSAGRFTSFSLSRREVPLFLSRKRGTSSPSRVVGYFGSHHPRRGTGTVNALRWVPQRSGQPVLCSQVPTRSLLTDSLATPGVGPPRARRPQSRPLRRCGTLWHMSPAHRFFRFFRYPRGTPR